MLLSTSYLASGQANYISIFGNSSVDVECNSNYRLNCTTAISPSSFAPIADAGSPGTDADYFNNSCYDVNGNLLFTVNKSGIFDAIGNNQFLFDPSNHFPVYIGTGGIGTEDCFPGKPVSEISIFPFPGKCNAYYVVFWAADGNNIDAHYGIPLRYELRAIEVDIDPNSSTYPVVSSCIDNVIVDHTIGYIQIGIDLVGHTPFHFALAADALNSDGTRDLYTIDPKYCFDATDLNCGVSFMRKWTIGANGSLPTSAYTYADYRTDHKFQTNAYSPKAKIFNIGGTKYFTYISGTSGGDLDATSFCTSGYFLNLYTLSDATSIYASTATTFNPVLDKTYSPYIVGFEYVPAQNVIYFTSYSYVASWGGIGYFDASGNSYFSFNNTSDYMFSDVELNKNGDLLLVNGLGSTDGQLASLPVSSSSFSLSTTITPTLVTSSCSTSSSFNIYSRNKINAGPFNPSDYYYLTSQVRGEDYSTWGNINQVFGQQIITTPTNWTTGNNPITAATGLSYADGITFGADIIIAPGGSLTIENMTIKMAPGKSIIVQNDPTGSATATGGRLIVNNSTITAASGCGNFAVWNGIVVNGDPHVSQSTTNQQGKANLNSSLISNAQTAVTNGDGVTYSGGIIVANNTKFFNNYHDIYVNPYRNMHGSIELNSIENFTNCTFIRDDPAFAYSNWAFVMGIKGMQMQGCNFYNNTGSIVYRCMEWHDAGLIFNQCSLNNFSVGISSAGLGSCYSYSITNSTFNNCGISISSAGDYFPDIHYNTIDVPPYTGVGPCYYPGSFTLMVNDQNTGVLLMSTLGFQVYNNSFKTDANGTPDNYYPYTSGVLAFSTGSQNNTIYGNTFKGLGVSMNSNFVNNNSAGDGLRFICDTDINTDVDISILGNWSSDGGINAIQCTFASSSFDLLSAGNKLSAPYTKIRNQQKPIQYYYTLPDENPGLSYFGLVTTIWAEGWGCPYYKIVKKPLDPITQGNPGFLKDMGYYIATNNVHYYMTLNDTSATPDLHRDSLYYWAGMMNTAYGDLLITNLLIEDSLIDSAFAVYGNIINKYNLDSIEANDFIQGQNIIEILVAHRQKGTSILNLAPPEVVTLQGVVTNSTMWAHVRAENWLYVFEGDPINDTLLYPDDRAPGTGVLALTEISQGPSNSLGCQYAEMIVANCGKDTANLVDISGWILDDNSGNFDNSGCDSNVGITPGHFRFANSAPWHAVPVGSIIIVYNATNNCYNLPDTFTINAANNIYYVPIPAQQTYNGYVMERYSGAENQSMCSYCSDSGTNVYTDASGWINTIYLDTPSDVMQVRCPGCNVTNTGIPPFYQGIGYSPAANYGFMNIAAGIGDAGGVIDINQGGAGQRFDFTGTNGSSFGAPGFWSNKEADSAGTIPPSLGKVSDELMANAVNHLLNMPCCDYKTTPKGRFGGLGKRNNDNKEQIINVYPNPAHDYVSFLFSVTTDAIIQLTDVTGRVLSQKSVTAVNAANLNIEGFEPGLHIYKVITKTKTQTGKVVIE